MEAKCLMLVEVKYAIYKDNYKLMTTMLKSTRTGSTESNLGELGECGILRDQDGEMLLAFATPLGKALTTKK
ncbi:hypothetical protein H5410_003063 [Solanum commersonii]|uniref:Uncharacterized protein n=1 Tax=Solanum commersonii TaxID=4109 RepID=A0A9J6B429_SOLCO|nr:hypothetical protein H5410_003063 [Solanum commersonii]